MADLCNARQWTWYYKDSARPEKWSACSVVLAVHRADTQAHAGGMSRGGEGEESRDGLGDEWTEGAQACFENDGIASSKE